MPRRRRSERPPEPPMPDSAIPDGTIPVDADPRDLPTEEALGYTISSRGDLPYLLRSLSLQWTLENMWNLIRLHKGNTQAVADALQCSRAKVYKWIAQYPGLLEEIQHQREAMVDKAENKLDEAIDRGNMAAIMFCLKTLGKHRGFTEKKEIEHIGQRPTLTEITVVHNHLETHSTKVENAVSRDGAEGDDGEVEVELPSGTGEGMGVES